jgi:hypothetical protein
MSKWDECRDYPTAMGYTTALAAAAAQYQRYCDAYRALTRGTYVPADVATLVRFQTANGGAGGRSAGSPAVDEDRIWRQSPVRTDGFPA